MDQLKIEAVRSDATFVIDFDKWQVLAKQDKRTVMLSLEDVLHRLAAACGLTPETTDAAIDKMKAELEQLHSSNRQQ